MTLSQVSVAISLCAVALGAFNFWRAHHVDKRNLFLRLHETLLEPDAVAGRRALYKIASPSDALEVCRDEAKCTQIYRALALFDVLGLYVESGWVTRDTVLKEWSNSLVRSRTPAELWVSQRYKGVQWHEWPHYKGLVRSAERVERGRALLAGRD